MREKKPSVVLSFATTTQAMKAEKCLLDNKVPGRLIPVPREITAGCGLAWKSLKEDRDLLMDVVKANDLPYQAETELMLV
ncbi:MAG: DUF3343 domain-containing protein [Lachnospiraceae bacterium]|nr:DUF3343 domain-containing protein [Lachnospiraceae bacterium]